MLDEDIPELRGKLLALVNTSQQKNGDPFPKNILHDQGNAKLGDSFVNFLFSVAKSLCWQRTTGLKVADAVLSNAYKQSRLKEYVFLKGNKDVLGDKIEALLLWTWLSRFMDFTEMVNVLRKNLDTSKFNHHEMEKITSTEAFCSLFDEIASKLENIAQ
ncbi:MAG: ribonuclease III family protein [Candidatus Odinarchaeota archaeon]